MSASTATGDMTTRVPHAATPTPRLRTLTGRPHRLRGRLACAAAFGRLGKSWRGQKQEARRGTKAGPGPVLEFPSCSPNSRSTPVCGATLEPGALRSARSGAGPAGCRMRVLTPKRSLPESRANRRSRFPRSPRRRASRRQTYVVIPSRPRPSVGGVTSLCLRIRTATEQPFAPRDSVVQECSW